MKKLPTSCAVVVFLAALAYQADATIIALTKGTGTPGTLTAMDVSRLTEYDLTSAKNEIPDAVYVRDSNDLILPTTSAAMPGSLILENNGLPEYNPMPDVATLFSAKDLFAANDPDYDLRAGIVTLFFDEDLFAGNQLVDAIYILRDNIIPSAAPDAILNRLTLENSGTIKHNPTTNIAALHLGESIFANMDTYASYRRIDVLYVTADGFATPEPTTIVILGLGSLYLLRKRKGV